MSLFAALPRRTWFYIAGVVAAALAVEVFLIRYPPEVRVVPGQIVPLLVVFGVASVITEIKSITTPAGDHKTITSAIFIALILLLGPELTLPPVVVAMVGSHIILRRPWFKAVFNVAQYTLTVGVSGALYQWTGMVLGEGPTPDLNSGIGVGALVVLAISYFTINSGLVAGVVAVSEGRPFLYVWNLANLEMLVQYAATMIVGVIIALLWGVAPWSEVLVAVILLSVYVSNSLAESLQIAQRDLLLRMDELQRRTAELALLNQINSALTRAPDLAQLWDVIYEQAGRVFDAACFYVALRDENAEVFQIAFGRAGDAPISGQVVEPNRGIIGQIQRRHEPILIAGDEATALDDGLPEGTGIVHPSILAAPMIVEGDVQGVIVAESGRSDAYSEDDLRVLAAIADQAAVALEKTRLQKEATETRAMHRLNMLKAEFISSVSHELRSPLTPIVGFSELLSATTVEPDAVRDMAGEIHRHAQRMQRLVDDLLDVSHMEAGRFRIEMTEVDLDRLLDHTVREFSRQLDRHQIVYRAETYLPLVHADPVRLRQVLDNLLTNAVKYSPNGGRIDVVARQCDSEVTVAVTDQGIGLPPEKIGRLFEKFYRVDNALAHRVRGSGLGLAIVKHIVDAHGGRILVESEPGRGSTFSFTVPVSATAQSGTVPVENGTSAMDTTNGQVRLGEGRSGAEAYSTGG